MAQTISLSRARERAWPIRHRAGTAMLTASIAFLVVAASPASAAVTIGSDLAPAPNGALPCFAAPAACTWANTALPGQQVASQLDGVVVRWRARVGSTGFGGQQVRLKVIRPGPLDAYTAINVSATHALAASGVDTTHVFPTSQAIKAGDQIALDADTNVNNFTIEAGPSPGQTELRWDPSLAISESRSPDFTFTDNGEILVNADVEPDADCDGLGDETQDPSVSGGCLPSPAAPAANPAAKASSLASGGVKTDGKNVPLQLSCAAGGGNCDANQLTLQTAGRVRLEKATIAAKRKKGKRITLGNTSFSIPAGQTRTVIVPLTNAGRKLFKLRKKVAANATVTGGGASSTAALQIKLKGKKKRK